MPNEYSAFRNKRKTPITLDSEECERAMKCLYKLHSFLVDKERCRKNRRKNPLTAS